MRVSVGRGRYMFRSLRDELLLGGSAVAIMVSVGAAAGQEPGAQPPAPPANTPQSTAPAAEKPPADAGRTLPTIEVAARRAKPRQAPPPPPPTAAPAAADPTRAAAATPPPTTASERVVSGEQINSTPTSRTVEIFEATPGLIANSHSAEGKAPQYFLRGFQLDHGTDFLIMV